MSKVVNRVVAEELVKYLQANKLMPRQANNLTPRLQLAY